MAAADRVPALSPDAEAYGPAAAAVLVVDGGVTTSRNLIGL